MSLTGLFVVNPNEAKVVQIFGDYVGTVRTPGLRWANPFYTKRRVSLRVRNFESAKLKVNDHDGNPIEIAAVVVWRVVDTAEAMFEVDDYSNFVQVQSEAALRNLATALPLRRPRRGRDLPAQPHRGDRGAAAAARSRSGWRRPASRCSRRASATSPTRPRSRARCCSASRRARSSPRARRSSRARSAWSRWRSTAARAKGIVELDDERRAAMVSNLLVVLCSDRHAQPVVNAPAARVTFRRLRRGLLRASPAVRRHRP